MTRCGLIALAVLVVTSASAQTKPTQPNPVQTRSAQSNPAQTKPAGLRTYATRYYVIHTDLGRDAAREAELRLTRMAEEYRRRTSEISARLPGKLPFYLFQREADYHAAGGTPNTAGEYNPNTRSLMAFTGEAGPNLQTWHAVQHEGFHQFADEVIGGPLPIWANEGLAEYFAESVFTGDAFVPGVVPQWRLSRIRRALKADSFAPLHEIVSMSHAQWNQRISVTNYDYVWSLVHFLVHADGGALQEKFIAFLKEAGTGISAVDAFVEHLGEVEALEGKWRAYWQTLPDDPTADLYAGATLRTLANFLARATARRQRFDSFDAFVKAAEAGELKASESDWLPPSLLKVALARVGEMKKTGAEFSIVTDAPRPPRIALSSDAGRMVGSFTLRGARVDQVSIERAADHSP